MRGFKVGDVIINDRDPGYNWLKLQLFEDKVLILDARQTSDIGTYNYTWGVDDYNRDLFELGQWNRWFCVEQIVDKVLKKYSDESR